MQSVFYVTHRYPQLIIFWATALLFFWATALLFYHNTDTPIGTASFSNQIY